MKRNFKSYALIWAIMLAAFNAVVFLVRPVIPGYAVNYDARFWIAWGFILAAFAGNLICAYFAFKAQSLKKLFYNLPLITVSCAGLIVMLVLGGALMQRHKEQIRTILIKPQVAQTLAGGGCGRLAIIRIMPPMSSVTARSITVVTISTMIISAFAPLYG